METKFLGTNKDESLNRDQHIERFCSKLNKEFYAIKQLKLSLYTEGLLCIYFFMVYSHMVKRVNFRKYLFLKSDLIG